MNLIPGKNKNSMSYWCSWHTQNIVAMLDRADKLPADVLAAMMQGSDGAKSARMMMNEELIFGDNGYAYQYEDVRSDMYFMLDDGWDVDYGINPDKNADKFGSLTMSEQRFPSVKGLSPAQRLKVINEKIKSLGWKGIGIWVAAQRSAEDFKEPFCEKDLGYWKERVLWSKEAGVEYWKVDWGTQQDNNDFRRALTEIGHELYPELVIEHAACMGAVNAFNHSDPALSGRYAGMEYTNAIAKEAVKFSQVYRSYDVLNALAVPTTLDRLASLLEWADGYINGEDECYINAALGCHCGIMRSHYCQEAVNEVNDTRGWRLNEVTAAIRWQRISPAFAGTSIETSEEILADDRFYNPGDSWWGGADGKRLVQKAPAVTARNLPVNSIRVDADVKPYIAASLNPNGAYSIAVLPRVIDGNWHYPKAEVWCDIPDGTDTVGVFGDNCDVHLNVSSVPSKVYVQSLLENEACELNNGIAETNDGCTVTITRETMRKYFNSTDKSAPALVIRIVK